MMRFEKIRARAGGRKEGDAVLQSLLGPVPDNAALVGLTDDRVLSLMAERIFSAGFVWKVIREKWPDFEEAFLGFEPMRLLFQPEDYGHDDKRIVRNPQKIKAVRDNAAFVTRVSAEHGGFGKFLADWPKDDQIGLTGFLGKNGTRLGGNTGQYFLRRAGWDAFILSSDVVLALRDAGLDIADAPTSRKDLMAIQEQMNRWATETGLPYVHLSRILAMSIGENRSLEALKSRLDGEE
ncbi:MAG: DNA-3-methyladenine glycosylase I [Rhizobiales bacterium]|nr:DNA-3-methyladenine glycosylase I [Hyphomicrobiales bacterium]